MPWRSFSSPVSRHFRGFLPQTRRARLSPLRFWCTASRSPVRGTQSPRSIRPRSTRTNPRLEPTAESPCTFPRRRDSQTTCPDAGLPEPGVARTARRCTLEPVRSSLSLAAPQVHPFAVARYLVQVDGHVEDQPACRVEALSCPFTSRLKVARPSLSVAEPLVAGRVARIPRCEGRWIGRLPPRGAAPAHRGIKHRSLQCLAMPLSRGTWRFQTRSRLRRLLVPIPIDPFALGADGTFGCDPQSDMDLYGNDQTIRLCWHLVLAMPLAGTWPDQNAGAQGLLDGVRHGPVWQ